MKQNYANHGFLRIIGGQLIYLFDDSRLILELKFEDDPKDKKKRQWLRKLLIDLFYHLNSHWHAHANDSFKRKVEVSFKDVGKISVKELHDCPTNIYFFKVINRNTRQICDICSKLRIKTPEWCHWRRFGVFILNFDHISHLFLVLLLLTLNKWTSSG